MPRRPTTPLPLRAKRWRCPQGNSVTGSPLPILEAVCARTDHHGSKKTVAMKPEVEEAE